MNRNLCFCFTMLLIRSGLAQSIAGPQQGIPGEQLVFRLINGSAQLAVDRWVQELNPDRYAGNDYVSSFTLPLTTSADGTLTATAPSPGRYKIAAWKGSRSWETYVRVRPQTPLPEIRGASFVTTHSPLVAEDKSYASGGFALAKRAGMNWAAIGAGAYVDLDSADLQTHIACLSPSLCFGITSLDDLGWLIDEARAQGLKVALYPNFYGKTKQQTVPPSFFWTQQISDGTIGDMPAILQTYPSLIPSVMRSEE